MDRVATLQELESHWSIDDVLKMNALLDMRQAIRDQEAQKIRQA